MAHVLIGWEFGANRGHGVRIARVGAALKAAGHEISYAVQRIDGLSREQADGAPVWQAPVSPRLLLTGARPSHAFPVGMADIVARLGMDDPAIVAAMIGGWRHLIGAVRPDLVVAEFAPFLQLAARGRLPVVATATGFQAPPSAMADFPRLIDHQGGVDQAALLESVNQGLAAAGAEPLDALPRMFGADRVLVDTLVELDPYADRRETPPTRPVPADFDAVAGSGEEVFVYAPEGIAVESPLWQGLATSGLPVRVHVPRAGGALREALAGRGFAVETAPIPFGLIAERSRLLVSHGGHGFLCAGLTAGLPHIVFHYDLEKLLAGFAVARHGLGGHVPLATLAPDAFAASLVQLHGDDALASRARAAGADFRGRGQVPAAQAVTEAVAALA